MNWDTVLGQSRRNSQHIKNQTAPVDKRVTGTFERDIGRKLKDAGY